VNRQESRPSHQVFHFLSPEAALRLKRVEDEIAAGRLNVLDLYREASAIFKFEQEPADRHLIVRRDVGL
jgi:hypothetical protein